MVNHARLNILPLEAKSHRRLEREQITIDVVSILKGFDVEYGNIQLGLKNHWASIATILGEHFAGMCAASTFVPDELFQRWLAGDAGALQDLLPVVYEELRRVARHHLRRERAGHTLQTTALIHETYLRLVDQSPKDVRSRTHFIALSSHLMRQILVDHARKRLAHKRQGGCRISLSDEIPAPQQSEIDVLAVDEALSRLALLDPQQARITELRYFGGLSIQETSLALGVSPATVKRDWASARAWLHREMQRSPAP